MGTALEADLAQENSEALAQALCLALGAAEGAPVEHLQTHLSHLLLTPSHAYKLKKPLCLPFADFSTLAARRHFCSEELRLNQRLAPALYLDILPVLGSVQQPRIGTAQDAGAAIDWVLRMRRFPAGSEPVRVQRLHPGSAGCTGLSVRPGWPVCAAAAARPGFR